MEADAEKALIELAQSGDELAYDSLFTLYRPRVYRIVQYILRDDAEAEDVVQDIFLKLFKALGSFRHESSFFTWIYKVAVNAARSRLSSRAREAHLLADSGSQVLEESYSSEADQPEFVHQRAEQVRMLDLAITSLQPNLREAFLLREVDGLSYAEIADLMHCPVGTVRSRISRAKSFLAERIAAPKADGG
jgi:RNA polymerase sigma-70 factor (ECF subfamily)